MTNTYGVYTLFKKEILRFAKVGTQTLGAPIISSLLYLLIFSNALQDRVLLSYTDITYIQFLIPGLIMMSIMQNSFANVSSSLIQSKVSGNIIFILLPPLSTIGIFIAFVGAALVRGLIVGLGIFISSFLFEATFPSHWLWTILFATISGTSLGTLGLIAGIVAEKFDQTAVFQNFIIMPLTFLSGVFYSIQNLPKFWYNISQANPFFYLVDGFRYGFFGQSDINPIFSLGISLIFLIILTGIAILMLQTGYKIKS